ncbi:Tubulin alpha-1 chain [Thelohanellus kitauei]|uniref:Tubulin alpha-1 chain n=1 Tax=Thelohanellus kitauei TaxID=669202 RepID=A0A0C2N7U9_THEKT|nr:Tubulin alpha-1 chain [Thelohanellus kitauei]
MRECVSFHIGGCGSQIGSACWDLLRTEHQISNTGSLLANNNLINHFPFFEEVRTKYVPRALFIDTEPLVLDEIRRNDDGVFFHPDRLINANEDAANNFARGFFRLTRELENIVENISRRTLETCDNLQGFLVYHSLGGGTGSGYTPNLLKKLSDDNPKKCILNMAIYPSSKTSNAIVEPYNTLFGLQHISESSDCLILFDNHSMHKVCHSKLRIRSPHYADLNNLLAQVMASMTCSLRSPGTLNVDLAEFPTNLVPFD